MTAPTWPDESDVEIIETAAALGNLTGVLAKEDLDRLRADPTNPRAGLWSRQLESGLRRLKESASSPQRSRR